MIARLQQLLSLSMLALSLAWLGWSAHLALAWPWRVLGALVLLAPHAPVLAIEFALLAWLGDPRPAPAPTARMLLRAWASEVRMGWLTFGWRQPWRSRALADHLPQPASTGRTGVLLVHGFVCNRGLWMPWMRKLRAAQVPHLAISLEPVFGDIDDYLPQIDAAVAQLQAATGRPPLIVAHSMGGLAVRAWLQAHAADERSAGVITIGTPHHGTWLARFALSANGRQMRRHSPWLLALAAAEPAARRERFTCFYSHCDNIVFPAGTACLPGADNRHLAATAHVQLVARPEILNEVLRRVGAPDT
ncbi:MAG: permease [Burkholderiales bacterium]|nr:permease [Burkholderiales bacterium]